MKCPRCKSHELDVEICKGYSEDPVKTCNECGYKWVKRQGKEIKEV